MPRAQNAHAMVDAGFLFQLDRYYTVEYATIVYGNINPRFVHATETENLLKGKKLFDNKVLADALASLDKEIKADVASPNTTPEYRKGLAIALFYKVSLTCHGNQL